MRLRWCCSSAFITVHCDAKEHSTNTVSTHMTLQNVTVKMNFLVVFHVQKFVFLTILNHFSMPQVFSFMHKFDANACDFMCGTMAKHPPCIYGDGFFHQHFNCNKANLQTQISSSTRTKISCCWESINAGSQLLSINCWESNRSHWFWDANDSRNPTRTLITDANANLVCQRDRCVHRPSELRHGSASIRSAEFFSLGCVVRIHIFYSVVFRA